MFNMDLVAWGEAITVFLLCMLLALTYNRFLYPILSKIADYTPTEYDDFILAAFKRPLYWLLMVLGVYWGIKLSPYYMSSWNYIFLALLRSTIIICVSWAFCLLFSKENGFLQKMASSFGEGFSRVAVNIASPLAKFTIIVLAVVLVGREFDYDVSIFFASLSLGSVAVAFAAKDVLANLFGSAVVILDKPFIVGDWVVISNIEGIVESISFRSTAIRKFSQELVFIPNSTISGSPVVNVSRMRKRRLDFKFHLSYFAESAKLERFTQAVKEFLESKDYSLGEATVSFVAYDNCYMTIRVIMYVKVYEFYGWLKLLNEVNFGIKKLAEKHDVQFAVPTLVNYAGDVDNKDVL